MMNDEQELKEAVKEFFNKYLNRVEESDSGRVFHPITVSCCRAMMIQPLGELLERMRVLSGANEDPSHKMREEDNG
jgi:DNA-directed RNA polymerase subunit N (RpoN/RPB10)